MKKFKQILMVVLMALVIVSSLDAEAQSRKSRSKSRSKAKTTQTVSTDQFIKSLSNEVAVLSRKCPIALEGGLGIIESVSFKNKCLKITYKLTDKCLQINDDPSSMDYSYLDYTMKLMIANVIKSTKISSSIFGKSGISFHYVFKDNYGIVRWEQTLSSSECVAFYKEAVKNGEMPTNGNTFNMEYFRQVVQSWDAALPEELDEGMTATKVTMEGTRIIYYVQVSYANILFMETLSEEDNELIRESIAQDLYDTFIMLGKSGKKTFLDNMESLGISINYYYYADNMNRPVKKISLPASYINRVGRQNR